MVTVLFVIDIVAVGRHFRRLSQDSAGIGPWLLNLLLALAAYCPSRLSQILRRSESIARSVYRVSWFNIYFISAVRFLVVIGEHLPKQLGCEAELAEARWGED